MGFFYLLITILLIWAISRVAGMRLRLNLLPTLQSGEKVLFVEKWVAFCTYLSSPTYRWSFSLPPVMDQGFYVTDKRVLHILHIFRLFSEEFNQCFGKETCVCDTDFIKEIRTSKHWLCGPYLEIVSENATKQWGRSTRARLRLYMRNPEPVCKIIADAMTKNTQSNANPADFLHQAL
jgi:hypothetical protein